MLFKRKSYADPNTVDRVVPKSERGVFWSEFDRLLSDYRHSNGENPSAGGLFTSNAYYLYDIIGGETPVGIRRYNLNGNNREFIVGFDRKYKAEIYRGSREASRILDAILAKGVGSVRSPNGIDGEPGMGNGGLAPQGMLEGAGAASEKQDNVGPRSGEKLGQGIGPNRSSDQIPLRDSGNNIVGSFNRRTGEL